MGSLDKRKDVVGRNKLRVFKIEPTDQPRDGRQVGRRLMLNRWFH